MKSDVCENCQSSYAYKYSLLYIYIVIFVFLFRTFRAQYVQQFSRAARHSDTESEIDADATDEDEDDLSQNDVDKNSVSAPFTPRSQDAGKQNGWLSWCSLL